MHAQLGKNAGDRGRFRRRAAEFGLDRRERQGAASGALPQARRTGSRDPARPRRFDGATARLPQQRRPPAADPAGTRRARGFRCRGAGARRGDRVAPDARRRRQSRCDARRPLSARPLCRYRGPRRGAPRRRTRDDRAREVDWAQAAEECAKDRRSLAPMGGGTRRRRSRQA